MVEPLVPVAAVRRRSAAEEARTVVASTTRGTLCTLTPTGDPWGAFVAHAQLPDGAPVLCVSTYAEHGRDLRGDPRASLVVAEDPTGGDPLDLGRVTLAGRVTVPAGGDARDAFLAAVPAGRSYVDFEDFTVYVLRVERVRWVGGYGRMDTVAAADYATAQPDPVGPSARAAAAHMDADHPDALLDMARALGGFPDATVATCVGVDRYGIDLAVTTPRGDGRTRVAFEPPCAAPGDLRAAAVALTRRARALART